MKRLLTTLGLTSFEAGVLLTLTIISLFIRLYHVGETLPFTYDQGRDMLVLEEMASGDVKLVGPTTGIAGLFLGPFYFYFLLPGFILSGGDPVGVAIWNAVIISLSLVFFYLLLKPLVGKKWAVFGYALLVLVPGALENARTIWNPSLTVSTMLISTWALFASKRHPWLLSVSLIAYGLCLQTELAYAVFLAPAYAGWVLWYGPWSSTNRYYTWKQLLGASAGFALTLAPQLLFELKNNFLMTRSVLAELGDSSKTASWQMVLLTRPGLMGAELGRQLFANIPGTTALTVALTGVGLTLAARSPKRAEERWWLAMLVLPLLGMMLFRGNHGAFFNYYLSPHYLPILAVLVLALTRIPVRTLVQRWWRNLVTLTMFIMIGAGFWRYWPLIGQPEIFNYTLQHQIQAVQYILEAQPDRPQAWDVFVPNLLPTQYTYLYTWLSRQQQLSGEPLLITDQDQTYFLLSEPAFGGGSAVSYAEWYQRSTQNATCSIDQQFGIVTVEHCQRIP